jgi:hypothetical protein
VIRHWTDILVIFHGGCRDVSHSGVRYALAPPDKIMAIYGRRPVIYTDSVRLLAQGDRFEDK